MVVEKSIVPFLRRHQIQCTMYQQETDNEKILPNYPNPKFDVPVKLKDFDGSEDFNDFLAHFEFLVTLHGWDYGTKSLFWPVVLLVVSELFYQSYIKTQRMDYKSLVDI